MYTCIICSPIRTVGRYILRVYYNMLKIQKLFRNSKIIFYYDISEDNTLDIVKILQEQDNNIILLENNEPMLPYRTYRIANARNCLLDYVYKYYSDFDFFIMMDGDKINSDEINIDVLKFSLDNKNKWDGLSFNRKYYYDIWALLYEPYIINCFNYAHNYHICDIMRVDITNKLNNINENDFFECYSAFNGFGIYQLNKFKNIKYDGKKVQLFSEFKINECLNNIMTTYKHITPETLFESSEQCELMYEICEHQTFHVSAIRENGARIYISPKILFNGYEYDYEYEI